MSSITCQNPRRRAIAGNDQSHLTLWCARHATKAALDTQATLFRSMVLGMVDKNHVKTRHALNCGDLSGRLCGGFQNPTEVHFTMAPSKCRT